VAADSVDAGDNAVGCASSWRRIPAVTIRASPTRPATRAVRGCSQRAAGWVGAELVPPGLDVLSDGPRVYLCANHGPTWWPRTKLS